MNKSVLIPYDRYIYYKSLVRNKHSTDIENKQSTDTKEENPTLNTIDIVDETQSGLAAKLEKEIILTHLPKRDRAKALSLLNVVEQNPNLDWNVRGEILVKNEVIPYSHISDLVRDALRPSRFEPVGCREFYSNLDNTPLSLISNPNRRALVGGKSLPPPGIPDKKAVPLNNWSSLWKKL